MNKNIVSKIEEFYSQYPAREWRAGQILVQANDHPQGVYFIESGGVKQYTIDHRGGEIVVNTFHKPSFFPMSWAINDKQNEYYFETIVDSTLRCAPQEEVLSFIKDNPDVALDLLHRVYKGLDGLLMRMVHLMSSSAYVRVLYELVIQTKRLEATESRNILLPIKEFELATYCGLTPETISREFKKLKKRKLVKFNNNDIVIVDFDKLAAELVKQP